MASVAQARGVRPGQIFEWRRAYKQGRLAPDSNTRALLPEKMEDASRIARPTSATGVSGERAAATYSLIGSAKLNRVDPAAYLRAVLERIADHPINRIQELLPWNLALAEADHARPAA